MDWCAHVLPNGTVLDPRIQYPEMSQALNDTGVPIFFALCEWGLYDPWTWAKPVGNSWRTGQDHHDNWPNTISIIEHNEQLALYGGPGGWGDMDFLMTGGQGCENASGICPGMTQTEYMTEFSIWAILQSPMLVATDPRIMTPNKKMILYNTEIIAVNQDPNGLPGSKVGNYDCDPNNSTTCSIWSKVLSDGSHAVVLFNRGEQSYDIVFDFGLIGWANTTLSIRDLWAHQELGVFNGTFTSPNIESHGVTMLKVTLIG